MASIKSSECRPVAGVDTLMQARLQHLIRPLFAELLSSTLITKPTEDDGAMARG
jgi:hypothetical protein